jgi:hypothetical protein
MHEVKCVNSKHLKLGVGNYGFHWVPKVSSKYLVLQVVNDEIHGSRIPYSSCDGSYLAVIWSIK